MDQRGGFSAGLLGSGDVGDFESVDDVGGTCPDVVGAGGRGAEGAAGLCGADFCGRAVLDGL